MSANATKKVSKTRTAKALSPANDVDTSVHLGRGAEGMRLAQGLSRALRGRPKKGATPTGTGTRSLRLPLPEWEALDAAAAQRGLTAHGAMREAIVQWLARTGARKGK